MKQFTLKINYNNLKNNIEKDYFHYLDFFYKSFILYIAYNETPVSSLSSTTMLENQLYDDLLKRVISSGCYGANIPELRDVIPNIHSVLDMQVFLEDFIKMKHNNKTINVYNVTIDHTYSVVITNKQFTKYAL